MYEEGARQDPVDARIDWAPRTRFPRLEKLALDYSPTESTTLHELMLSTDAEPYLRNVQYLKLLVPVYQSLGAFEQLVVKYSTSIEHLVLDFGSRFSPRPPCPRLTINCSVSLNREDPEASAFSLPTMPNLRSLTFEGAMTEIQIPNSLMTFIPTLLSRTPKLEVLTFAFDGDWEARPKTTRCAHSDSALTSHKHLREVKFAIDCEMASGNLVESVIAQLPLTCAAGRIMFSDMYGKYHNAFSEYFGE